MSAKHNLLVAVLVAVSTLGLFPASGAAKEGPSEGKKLPPARTVMPTSLPGSNVAATPVFCNPLNLNYQVQRPNAEGDQNVWLREGADPAVGLFKDKYYLFSSVSDGYWESENLVDWKSLIPSSYCNLPILHCYAPTVVVVGDTMYLKDGNGSGPVYGTRTPEDPDSWKQVSEKSWHRPDAQFFLDDDGRLWIAYGCSATGFLHIMEIDTGTFMPKGESQQFYMPDTKSRGWEGSTPGKRGTDHTDSHGWVEGGQLLKENGTYYFIYSLPGLNNAYANGVYTAKNILGPYTHQKHNPISQKLTGFVTGAAHGEFFKDRYGNWWNFVLHAVWTYDRFERRIGMLPASIGEKGVLLCNTWLGDYPMLVPQQKRDSSKPLWNGMNPLSIRRPVSVSSSPSDDKGNGKENIVDENVTTFWSAKTGDPGEWVEVDLGSPCLVEAVQANFGEVDFQLKQERPNTRHMIDGFFREGKTPSPDDFKKLIPESQQKIPRDPDAVIRYKVLGSLDGKKWDSIVDQSRNTRDTPHDFNLAPKPQRSRYVRLVNVHTPYNGKFALRELRVFGKGYGAKPSAPEFRVKREKMRKKMEINWEPVNNADGYVVRYGQEKDRLYLANQFYDTNRVVISSLETPKEYFVTVDAFNQNGYTEGMAILPVLVDDASAE